MKQVKHWQDRPRERDHRVWLILSPWVLGFSTLQTATGSAVASGVVVMVLALWVLATDKDYSGWLGKMTAH